MTGQPPSSRCTASADVVSVISPPRLKKKQ
jgi:hypothetical protein